MHLRTASIAVQDVGTSQSSIDLPDESASGNGNGALAVASIAPAEACTDVDAAHPVLSASWLLSLEAPALLKEVQAPLKDLGKITRHAESEMIAAVADSDHVVYKLFEWSGEKDVFSFVSYVRAHLIRTGRLPSPAPPFS